MHWLEDNWYNSTIFLAIYSSIFLLLFGLDGNFALFLIWVHTPVYFLHQFEEYIFPGGFVAFFNTKVLGSNDTGFPVTKTFSFWINIPIIFVGFPLSAILAGQIDISIGIWTAYFSIINALSHVGMFVLLRRYNPGLVVSVTLNIPVGLFAVGYFVVNDVISLKAHVVGLAVAIAVQACMMVYGFLILKPKIKDQSK